MAKPVGAGVCRITGRPLAGWPHVEQCLGVIFTTHFGSRVMRRWFGSLIPGMLGENLTPQTMLRFFTALYASLQFEPRFALKRISILSNADELRTGKLRLVLEGQYRPRAHLGDFTVEGPRRVIIGSTQDRTVIEASS
jgi:phage baseplate assembly protein W